MLIVFVLWLSEGEEWLLLRIRQKTAKKKVKKNAKLVFSILHLQFNFLCLLKCTHAEKINFQFLVFVSYLWRSESCSTSRVVAILPLCSLLYPAKKKWSSRLIKWRRLWNNETLKCIFQLTRRTLASDDVLPLKHK